MSSSTLSVFAAAAALALAACSPPSADPAADPANDAASLSPAQVETPAPAMPGVDPCDASAVQSFVGQEATEEVVEQARTGAGADSARTLRPGQAVTLEFREGRLNVDVDENGTITGLRCG